MHVLRVAELDEEGHHLFLTGGPGVGKSAVLKFIDIGLHDIYNKDVGEYRCRHIKVAFTGAACNVLGQGTGTIHSTFAVPINQNLEIYQQLSSEKLQQLQIRLLYLKWLIIDEISLVSNKLYNFINWRLQDIKGRQNIPFGGVNILCCGDLSQLPPVQGNWIFEDIGN